MLTLNLHTYCDTDDRQTTYVSTARVLRFAQAHLRHKILVCLTKVFSKWAGYNISCAIDEKNVHIALGIKWFSIT